MKVFHCFINNCFIVSSCRIIHIRIYGDVDRAVKHRINVSWMKWRQVTGTISDSRIPLKLKGKIYKTMIRIIVGEPRFGTNGPLLPGPARPE